MKKTISGITIMIIIFFSFNQALFADTSHWAVVPTLRLELLGILEGDLSKSSKMTNEVTRLEFAEMITKFYSYVKGESLERFGKISKFEDTDSVYVIAAYKLGIVKGVSETKFSPNSKITREQISTMVHRAIEFMGLSKSEPSGELFSDDNQISQWAREGVYFCKADKLIQGVGGGKFSPKGFATREQVIKILDNALISYGKGLPEIAERTEHFGRYEIPNEKNAQLSYSKSSEKGIELKITAPKYDNVSEFDIDKASQEVYFVLSPVWGHDRSKAVSLAMKKEWSISNRKFSDSGDYSVSNNGSITERSGKVDVRIYFNGSCTIELSK